MSEYELARIKPKNNYVILDENCNIVWVGLNKSFAVNPGNTCVIFYTKEFEFVNVRKTLGHITWAQLIQMATPLQFMHQCNSKRSYNVTLVVCFSREK